jgi:hypothetical protein
VQGWCHATGCVRKLMGPLERGHEACARHGCEGRILRVCVRYFAFSKRRVCAGAGAHVHTVVCVCLQVVLRTAQGGTKILFPSMGHPQSRSRGAVHSRPVSINGSSGPSAGHQSEVGVQVVVGGLGVRGVEYAGPRQHKNHAEYGNVEPEQYMGVPLPRPATLSDAQSRFAHVVVANKLSEDVSVVLPEGAVSETRVLGERVGERVTHTIPARVPPVVIGIGACVRVCVLVLCEGVMRICVHMRMCSSWSPQADPRREEWHAKFGVYATRRI